MSYDTKHSLLEYGQHHSEIMDSCIEWSRDPAAINPNKTWKFSMCELRVLWHWACPPGVWPQSNTTDLDCKKKTAARPETSDTLPENCAGGGLGHWACYPGVRSKSRTNNSHTASQQWLQQLVCSASNICHSLMPKLLCNHGTCPHRLVVRPSRCGRDNPGSNPGEDTWTQKLDDTEEQYWLLLTLM